MVNLLSTAFTGLHVRALAARPSFSIRVFHLASSLQEGALIVLTEDLLLDFIPLGFFLFILRVKLEKVGGLLENEVII